jgi:Cell division protein ZapA.
MPILKTEILGTDIEISYEKNEYDKLNNLIEKFKIRLSQFPNDGRASSNQILFLAALKTEDELETMKKKINVNANDKNLQNKNFAIEGLNKEIILLKKELEQIKSYNISNTQDNNSVLDEIKEIERITQLIQDRIKESVK